MNVTNQLSPVIHKLFAKRNFTQEDVNNFFSWNLNELPDLTSMHDLPKAADRIIEAIQNKERIAIYGDYDTDGTTSCALFHHFFKMLDVEIDIFQPSRFTEGYGLHNSSIDDALAAKVKLLITVDCGISNYESALYAKEKNLDLIITDHHSDICEELPPALAVVNPCRRDEPQDSPLRALAGVGVAFAVCWQIRKELLERKIECPSLYPLLQFVAIGTICDLAHLNHMNLKLTRHGLKQMTTTSFPGINVFFTPEEREMGKVPSEKLSFNIGPMINSKGRLEHPRQALNLLISNNDNQAFENYSHLEISNRERKFIQAEVFKSAKEQVTNNITSDEMLINIVYQPDWHEGVVGIVASKLVDQFDVPAIVLTNAEEKGLIKGSARSAGELSIFNCLEECSDLFTKFGGHKAAAGLSMPLENLPEFKERMNNILRQIPNIERTTQDEYDLQINFADVNPQLVKELDMLEPFGQGNPRPTFRMSGLRINSYKILKDAHVKWFFESKENPKFKLQGISFNLIGKWNQMGPEELYNIQQYENLTAQFQLGINRFNGNEYIQLMVDKIFV